MTETSMNNVDNIERVFRFFIGCSLIGSVMFIPVPFDYLILLPLIGIYPCLTAIVGWDPTYFVFGINREKVGTLLEDRLTPYDQNELLRPRFI